jgi:hypothetical protein
VPFLATVFKKWAFVPLHFLSILTEIEYGGPKYGVEENRLSTGVSISDSQGNNSLFVKPLIFEDCLNLIFYHNPVPLTGTKS